ncbi:hypothetical protein PENSPDRAFT_693596 [Peniophora sp. CONT]|nr:hypothetical protein PENSPDRAFT_693596 [Peniophora sp. CONT]
MDPADRARGYIGDAAVALGDAFNEVSQAIPIANDADRIYREAFNRTVEARNALLHYTSLATHLQASEEPRVSAILENAWSAIEESHRAADRALQHSVTLALVIGLAVLAVNQAARASYGLNDPFIVSSNIRNSSSVTNLASSVVAELRRLQTVLNWMQTFWRRASPLPRSIADMYRAEQSGGHSNTTDRPGGREGGSGARGWGPVVNP